MAKMMEPLAEDFVKKTTVANLRAEYLKLADIYRKILNNQLIYCPCCGNWKSGRSFYQSATSVDGIERTMCKDCIIDACTDYDKKTGVRKDNRQKTIATFKKLDWYFSDRIYNDQFSKLADSNSEIVRSTAVQQCIVIFKSLNNYNTLKFTDSEFFDPEEENFIKTGNKRKPRKETLKLFGSGFSVDDLLYLQDQYDDWCARTQVDSKSQQTYIIRICFKLLDLYKAQKSGKDTEKLDRSLNDLLAAANLQPRQNVGNAATDSLTFGQLIEQWEQTKPIPEPDPEFKDVNHIGKYIRTWFKGALARSLGIDNGYSMEYDAELSKYTVKKPEYQEDDSSDDIYKTIFGGETE